MAEAGVTLLLASCAKPPHPYMPEPCVQRDLSGCVIDDVTVVHNETVPSSEITEKLATAESKHPLGGIFENVPILSLWDRLSVEYERFDPFVLERDLARVERIYRSLGYYDAHARTGHVTTQTTLFG